MTLPVRHCLWGSSNIEYNVRNTDILQSKGERYGKNVKVMSL